MSALVLDCSITTTWLLDNEATPETEALRDRLKDVGPFVPCLRRPELGNLPAEAERLDPIGAAQILYASDSWTAGVELVNGGASVSWNCDS